MKDADGNTPFFYMRDDGDGGFEFCRPGDCGAFALFRKEDMAATSMPAQILELNALREEMAQELKDTRELKHKQWARAETYLNRVEELERRNADLIVEAEDRHNLSLALQSKNTSLKRVLEAAQYGLRNWETPSNRYSALDAINDALDNAEAPTIPDDAQVACSSCGLTMRESQMLAEKAQETAHAEPAPAANCETVEISVPTSARAALESVATRAGCDVDTVVCVILALKLGEGN